MNSINDILNELLRLLSSELTKTAIDTWFRDCIPVELQDYRLVICTKNDFTKSIIETRFSDKIKAALYELFASDFELLILVGEDGLENYNNTKSIPESNDNFPPEMLALTFDRFIVGNSNRHAFAAAQAVAKHPEGHEYNPLFIYGNSGLGKTHLLFAIGQHIRENYPEKKLIYVKGDDFTNRLVKAIQDRKMEDFRNAFRNVDLLLVDDIQFIAGKIQTQEEFFNTFNSIYEDGHQIVITSDRPPKEMSTLEDRLRSRFEGGVMADIQPADFETRIVITRSKAAQFGLVLSDEAIEYIANNVTANIRQIEGVIKSLTAFKEIIDDVITIDYVKKAIENVTRGGEFIPSPERIISETARYYNITNEDICGQNRSKNTAEARQIAMYLIRTMTNLSLKDIGELFTNRNHTTVLSSIRKIEDGIKADPSITSKVRDISSNVNSN